MNLNTLIGIAIQIAAATHQPHYVPQHRHVSTVHRSLPAVKPTPRVTTSPINPKDWRK